MSLMDMIEGAKLIQSLQLMTTIKSLLLRKLARFMWGSHSNG